MEPPSFGARSRLRLGIRSCHLSHVEVKLSHVESRTLSGACDSNALPRPPRL